MNSRRARALLKLKRMLPAGELRFEKAVREQNSGDKWFASHLPDAVAFPKSVRSVSRLLAFANEHRIPVTPRGAGYGYVGGCVPMKGGIALSMMRMNQIKEIHTGDFVVVVEPGVLTAHLQEMVERKGLFYPPDPASRADCSIGGNVATNAGGPRCLRYGVTRDYVLGLEVVEADGSVVRVGGRTHKNKTGFDFARLFTGSEGMLGVITEATLKLLPLPPFRSCLAVGFGSMKDAARTIRSILGAGFLPCALEVADAFTLAAAHKRTKSDRLKGCRAHLIVELDGQEFSVRNEIGLLQKIVRQHKPLFIEVGHGNRQCEAIWQLRREFSYSLRDTGLTKLNQDIVVPRSRLEDLFHFSERLRKKHGMALACFGHAGDGNIHSNVMVDMTQPNAMARSQAALDDLFKQVLAWKGVITGEHGIGLAKMPWWPLAASPELRSLHRKVKKALDPRGILNPGKFVQ